MVARAAMRGIWTDAERRGAIDPGKTMTKVISKIAAAGHSPLWRILDAVPDALLFVDERARVDGANRAARRLFGAAVVGRALSAVVDRPGLLDSVTRAIERAVESDVEISLAQPVMRDFRAHVAPLDGEGAVVVLHDETEVKRSEQLRVDFVANASHEIRSPLAAIVGLLETVRGPARDDADARERFLEVMAAEAARMAQLVEDLLSLSKIEMREHALPTGLISLTAVAEEVAATLSHRAEARRMTIAVDGADELPPIVGDADEIALMIRNLVLNSIIYGREGTLVRVALRACEAPPELPWAEDGAVAVAVTDESDGIAPEHIARLTERFYWVDKGRSRKAGGTGLGLAIVKHVVSRHRGLLAIESTPGVGSSFTIYIPAAGETA